MVTVCCAHCLPLRQRAAPTTALVLRPLQLMTRQTPWQKANPWQVRALSVLLPMVARCSPTSCPSRYLVCAAGGHPCHRRRAP